jgi:beta-galactosidase
MEITLDPHLIHHSLLGRNSAYNYWVPQLPTKGKSPGFSNQETTASSIIIKAGYLVRSAYLDGNDLHIQADFNATTPIEVVGAPSGAKNLVINGEKTQFKVDKNGIWSAIVTYNAPKVRLPDLKKLKWKSIDTLPELKNTYDDSDWTAADQAYTKNTAYPFKTPTSLFASDYGFNTGSLLYRGHFAANGKEKSFFVQTQGGSAYGHSVWINDTYVGSWAGNSIDSNHTATYTLPTLQSGKNYVITVVIDNMGLDENWIIGLEAMKSPRGILQYSLSGQEASAISWKLTGNLGGENYRDTVRGPLNEGGLYAERQGFHQPQPPTKDWGSSSPFTGLGKPGIHFYSASFDLDLPSGYDIPLYFNFGNDTSTPAEYRVQLYVNGYQYGKYVNHIGPQTSFPVPEGILNYCGTNWVALSLWAHGDDGAKLDSFELINTTPVLTSLGKVKSVNQPKYQARKGAY